MKLIKHKRQSGFTLIEVMVALVVLAVGMLGVAALYIESLRSGSMSVSYTNAVTLAADMADRIRANPLATIAYANGAVGNAVAGTAANNCVNGVVDCTPAQLATDDWNRWYEDVKNLLPVGRSAAVVAFPVGAIMNYTIILQWPERGQAAPVNYVMTIAL